MNKILLGISALIGLAVTGAVYKTALLAIDEEENQKLIGDGEILSDEVVEES